PVNLNDTTLINFTVNNDAASYAQNRFRIVFKTMPLLVAIPFTFTSVKAYQQDEQINVNWKTRNESQIKNFFIERSADGVTFSAISSVSAANLSSNSYEWTDHFPTKETSYYRIRSTDAEGKIDYSNAVKVDVALSAAQSTEANTGITLYPNPATVNNLNLKMINQLPGNYEVRFINSYGQCVALSAFNYNGGNSIQKIKAARTIPAGIYHLEITKPSGERQIINVLF
ncbi:MAG TPA: T9SS type A sorting domain-containing protein, partial [Hanamia sp.]|nr:T9SS type A sorting domain-containing protein [Hanamia sp.]